MEKDYMTIGELARHMNVTVRTLQYYDKEGLLKPSGFSEGGRRLYTPKDMIQLHQILSFKYLGFSLEEIKNKLLRLDTTEEVLQVLLQQESAITEQIIMLEEVKTSIRALRQEVSSIKQVDFKKYAEIVELLRMGNDKYWIWKFFDDTLSEHVQKRFMNHPEQGEEILKTYQKVLDRAYELKMSNVADDSEAALQLAEEWWQMIVDFTGGDLSLIPKLMEFNNQKNEWSNHFAEKQKEVDDFLGRILGKYFEKSGMKFPEVEQ